MSKYAYVRVSSRDQNEDRQLAALQKLEIPRKNVYIDKQSGKDFDRPRYRELIQRIGEDDLLYIKSIDRLGRNYREIIDQWKHITKDKGADICVLDMELLDTRQNKDLLGTFISDLVLSILSYVAENERDNIRQRQAEGIAAAKKRGVRFGRPPKPTPDNFDDVRRQWRMKKISVKEAAKECGMCPSTFYDKAVRVEKNYIADLKIT